MTEQLRTTKERSLAKPLRLIKPVGVAIGACMAYWGVADLPITSYTINRKLDQDYPSETVRLAQGEIEVFKEKVLKIDNSGQTNPQAIQAIDVADVAELKKERALKERELESQAFPRQLTLIIGGTIIKGLAIIASAAISASRRKNEKNTETF